VTVPQVILATDRTNKNPYMETLSTIVHNQSALQEACHRPHAGNPGLRSGRRSRREPSAVGIDLIDRPDQVPWGAGEPTAAMVRAAIGNAVFDAIGVRLRSVPFTPAKVLAAIKKS
jgi:hypothetical protein